jgi:hypothetical protein
MEDKQLLNFATQERVVINSVDRVKTELEIVKEELEIVKEELEFYKSIFKSHHNSVIFNLTIKKKNGKNVWVDPIMDHREYLRTLDRDEQVKEWLQPIKPSR